MFVVSYKQFVLTNMHFFFFLADGGKSEAELTTSVEMRKDSSWYLYCYKKILKTCTLLFLKRMGVKVKLNEL